MIDENGYTCWIRCTLKSPWWRKLRAKDRNVLGELKICSSTKNLARGKEIHAKTGNDVCIFVAAALIKMYAKCGCMDEARKVFEDIKHPDAVSWNALLLGYADNGQGRTALELFDKMKSQGFELTSVTFLAAVKACSSLAVDSEGSRVEECRLKGKQIHSEIGCHSDLYVQNMLIDMYAKSRSMEDAKQVFDSIEKPDVVSWNTLILGYAENGEGMTALYMYQRMTCEPNSITFLAALKACTSLVVTQDGKGKVDCKYWGKKIHFKIGQYPGINVHSALINMYAKCDCMVDARLVFDSITQPEVVSWTALILGYAENGEPEVALEMFASMKSRGCLPNSVTYMAALKACSSLARKEDKKGKNKCKAMGKQIHSEIGRHLSSCVKNSLIDMYSNCGSMTDAHEVFNSFELPGVVSWNALISGYAENGEGATAMALYTRMKGQGCVPNRVTFIAALKACTLLGELELGSKVHAEIDRGIESDASNLVTYLVDFYVKCGNLVGAQKLFDLYPATRDLITWNVLIAGYSRLGDKETVFELFEGMKYEGIEPDGLTFLCLLTCCSYTGLVEKANGFFEAMSNKHNIDPTLEHYNCMVDMLGRSNKLDDALALLRNMPCRQEAVIWLAVLGSCYKGNNVGLGNLAFQSLVSLDDVNASAYVLMGHIYGSRGMWEEKQIVLSMNKTGMCIEDTRTSATLEMSGTCNPIYYTG